MGTIQPPPKTTSCKNAKRAKELELAGCPCPKHFAEPTFGPVVHGVAAGIEGVRRGFSYWLDGVRLIDTVALSRLDRYIGYFESYAESHDVSDQDRAFQEEVRNVARAVANAVAQLWAGTLSEPDVDLKKPKPK